MRLFPLLLVACASTSSSVQDRRRTDEAALDAAYAAACPMRTYDEITRSPLTRHGLRATTTRTGAIVHLDVAAGTPPIVLADLRCHRAWMSRAHANPIASCPLDIPGLVVDVREGEEAILVELAVPDPALVPELQRRVAAQLAHVRRADR